MISVLVAIFLGALFIRLQTNFKQELLLGIDSPYYLQSIEYLLNNWPSLPDMAPPLVFHALAGLHVLSSPFNASLMTSLKIGSALISAIVVFAVYFMVKQLTKNRVTAVIAAFLVAFTHANVRIFQDLWKNALAVSLTPLSVLFFWRGMETGKKIYFLMAGFSFGAVALTHELTAGALGIAYLSYIGFLIGRWRQLPWLEIRAVAIMFLVAMCTGGIYFLINRGALVDVGHVSPFFGEALPRQIRIYDELMGPLISILAAVGAAVALHRKKATDIFLLAWGLSALMLAQPWVSTTYLWRFTLLMGMPLAIFAAVGLVEGIGALLKRSSGQHLALLCLILIIFAYQAQSAYSYAMRFRPTIRDHEYDALLELHDQLGDGTCLISDIRRHYWIEAIDMRSLSRDERALLVLRAPRDFIAAVELYRLQQKVGRSVYVLTDPRDPLVDPKKFESPLFKLIFARPFVRVYALSEDFRPPENLRPPPSRPEPPRQNYLALLTSNPLRIFIFPIDLANCFLSGIWSSTVKFALAVPLTVFLWVLIASLFYEKLRPPIVRFQHKLLGK